MQNSVINSLTVMKKIYKILTAVSVFAAALSCDKDSAETGSLKVGILGDSISTYEGFIDNSYKSYYPRVEEGVKADVDDWTKTYWGILLNQYWYAELDVNASYSGTCITPRTGFTTDFMTRAAKFKDPDVIIVNGGTNDYLKGKKGDGVVTPEKFKAAYEDLLAALQKNYPKAQIIMVVCDFVKGDYGDISVATAGKFGVPCVDLRADTKSIGKVYGDKTNPHPNAVGMAFIAEKIYNQTKSIVDAIKK